MPANPESLTSQFLKSVLQNSAKIPHDPKFPYLAAFAEKMKAQYAENPNLTLSQVIEGLNKDIKNNSRKRLFSGWFATSSSVSTGATGAALTIADAATRAASVALPVVAVVPAAVNLVYGAMNMGWQLNRDLEGRGYLLKYLENVTVLMIGDLYEKRKILAEKIEQEQDAQRKKPLQEQLQDLEKTIKSSLDELWKFNETHYKKEPFYYKWAAMSFKGIGSLTGAARLSLSIAATATAFFSGVGAAVLAGSLLVSDLVFTGLYRKSHRLRNEGAEKCATNLDTALEAAIGYYQEHEKVASLKDLGKLNLASPIKARENLKAALMEFKLGEYAKFLYRNDPERLEPQHIQLLDQKQKDALKKKQKHDEKHARTHSGHGHHKHAHGHRGHEHNHHHKNEARENHHEEDASDHVVHEPHHNHHDGSEHKHKHKHHHHHHHINDRYFGDDCLHNLGEAASKNSVKFQNLSEVSYTDESELSDSDDEKQSLLPFPTHVHLPFLNVAVVKKPMKLLERLTGFVAKIMGGRKYSVIEESPQNSSSDDLAAGEERFGFNANSPDSQGADSSEEEFGFQEESQNAAFPPNRTFKLLGRSGLVGVAPTVASTKL